MQRTLQSYGLEPNALFESVGLAKPETLTSEDWVEAAAPRTDGHR